MRLTCTVLVEDMQTGKPGYRRKDRNESFWSGALFDILEKMRQIPQRTILVHETHVGDVNKKPIEPYCAVVPELPGEIHLHMYR